MKAKIDTRDWKEYKFDKIFLFKRGKRLITQDQIPGPIPYISSTKSNNGIDNYILPPDNMPIYNNAITLNNSGSIGYCFYHTYNFVASDHCTILKLRDKNIVMDIYLFLFLKPVIENMRSKYGFAREMSDNRLKKEIINLPSVLIGNSYVPDWNFMSSYIKEQSQKVVFNKKIVKPKNTVPIDYSNWKEIKLSKLFDIVKGERLTESDRIIGETPLVTASSFNNGITSLIDYATYIDKKKYFKNKITVDMFCNVFYQDFEYFSDDNIHTLLFINDEYEKYYENKYVNLFLVSIIKKLSPKYGFGRQVRLKRIQNEVIKLPFRNNTPDFEFMENYIKSLPYSNSLVF